MVTIHKPRATRKDVAIAAGVCVTTVTHALADTPGSRVNEETKIRIKRIARELDYRPSFVGKTLSTGKNYMIGLLQPSLESLHVRYYQDIIIGISEAMEATDYNILSLYRKDDFRYMKVIEQGRIDGMIILQSDPDMAHINKIIETGIPTVAVNKNISSIVGGNTACVCPDHDKFMKDVVNDLKNAGCKSILAIHNYEKHDANVNMLNSFNDAIKKLTVEGITGATIMPDWPNFRTQCLNIFKSGQRWDGIFIDNSWRGDTVVEVASECGLKAGRDYILVTTSMVEHEFTSSKSELSYYSQQGHPIGQEAWKTLEAMINGTDEGKTVFVPYKRAVVNSQNLFIKKVNN